MNYQLWRGDCLEEMDRIEDGSIDLIYSDILYGTGRRFEHYQDIRANHKDVYDFYQPRLKQMHRLLSDKGSIFLQMDRRIDHWIRIIMDDIFGYSNFRRSIVWTYKMGGGGKTDLSSKHDVILLYSKGKNYTFNLIKVKSYVNKSKGYNPYTQQYEDSQGTYVLTNLTDVWSDIAAIGAHSNMRVYSSQKPEGLAERIILMSTNPGDIVVDFLCGSGVTLKVAHRLGRRAIGCDINPVAIQIAAELRGELNHLPMFSEAVAV